MIFCIKELSNGNNRVMEKFLNYLTYTISKNVSEYSFYFHLTPLVMTLALCLFLIIGIFSKKFRYKEKQFCFSLNAILLAVFFAFYVAIYGEMRNIGLTFLSLTVFALNFLLAEVLRIVSKQKVRLTLRDKRLIGRLTAEYKYNKPYEQTLKRIERITPIKEENAAIEPNLGEIKKLIDALRLKEITPSEEDELDKAEMDIEKFSVREPLPFERQVFSDRLLKIVKMISKYNIA